MSSEFLKKSLNFFSFNEFLGTPKSELRACGLTRRLFLRWLMGISLLPSFPFYVREAKAVQAAPPKKERGNSIAEFFKGEELVYEIGVWPFKRVALGKVSFNAMEKKGHYLAILQAETLGVLGWAARYRADTYRSIVEEIGGGKRLRALSFEEDVKIGNKLRKKIVLFDYQKRKWIKMRRRGDGSMGISEEEIPPGVIYDDLLTASYNFRYGVYGEIERGKKYIITTLPKKGSSTYEVVVTEKEEEDKRRKSEKTRDGKEFFIKLFLDPEVTHSKEGLIEGWLSKELYPLEGAIKDVVLFGDVKGTLVRKVQS